MSTPFISPDEAAQITADLKYAVHRSHQEPTVPPLDIEERRAERAARRRGQPPPDLDDVSESTLPPAPKGIPAGVQVVNELPSLAKEIPQQRLDMIAWLKEHPGQWVKYDPSVEGNRGATVRSLRSTVSNKRGGFDESDKGQFEATLRNQGFYVRWVEA